MMVLIYPDADQPGAALDPGRRRRPVRRSPWASGSSWPALNVFFRDIGNLARHVLRLWFYLSPALYGEDTVKALAGNHPMIATIMRLNPFYPILNGYRDAIYFGQMPDFTGLSIVLARQLCRAGRRASGSSSGSSPPSRRSSDERDSRQLRRAA